MSNPSLKNDFNSENVLCFLVTSPYLNINGKKLGKTTWLLPTKLSIPVMCADLKKCLGHIYLHFDDVKTNIQISTF